MVVVFLKKMSTMRNFRAFLQLHFLFTRENSKIVFLANCSPALPPLLFSPPSFLSLPFIYSKEGFPSEDAMGEKGGASAAVGERKEREPPLRTDGGRKGREAASSASGQLLIALRGKEDHERVSLQRTGAGQTRRRGEEEESFFHFLFHLLFFALPPMPLSASGKKCLVLAALTVHVLRGYSGIILEALVQLLDGISGSLFGCGITTSVDLKTVPKSLLILNHTDLELQR